MNTHHAISRFRKAKAVFLRCQRASGQKTAIVRSIATPSPYARRLFADELASMRGQLRASAGMATRYGFDPVESDRVIKLAKIILRDVARESKS